MQSIIIPHFDSNKAGATEHVAAVVQALNKILSTLPEIGSLAITQPVDSKYQQIDGKSLAVDLTEQLESIKNEHGDAYYIVVTGDYGGDSALRDTSLAATFKRVLGTETKVLLSSYTAESKTIIAAFEDGAVDFLAVPRHAVDPEVLHGTRTDEVITREQDRLILMTAVPHILTSAMLQQKRNEWDAAAADKKVKPIPKVPVQRHLVTVIIPGDVEDANGKPKLFDVDDGMALADAIAGQIRKENTSGLPPLVLVSNGPRTGKYKKVYISIPDFNPNKPEFQNTERMNSLNRNTVAFCFVERLRQHWGQENVISGCIEKGKVPPQGFLAFYDALNQHVATGGQGTLYIDGVSTTMMAQAANVIDPRVKIIACDTPAKNKTHDAGVKDLFAGGHVHKLSLQKRQYVLEHNPLSRAEASPFDDATFLAECILQISGGHRPVAKPGMTFPGCDFY